MRHRPPNALRLLGRGAFVRLASAGVLTLALLVLGPAPTCWACSCVGGTPRELAATADAVFVATVSRIEDASTATQSDLLRYVVTVESVSKGRVPQVVRVRSHASEAACGLAGMRVDGRYLFMARGTGQDVESGLCSGTQVLTAGQALPELGLPVATGPIAGGDASPASRGGPWRWVVGVGVLGAGLTAFALVRRRSRRVPL